MILRPNTYATEYHVITVYRSLWSDRLPLQHEKNSRRAKNRGWLVLLNHADLHPRTPQCASPVQPPERMQKLTQNKEDNIAVVEVGKQAESQEEGVSDIMMSHDRLWVWSVSQEGFYCVLRRALGDGTHYWLQAGVTPYTGRRQSPWITTYFTLPSAPPYRAIFHSSTFCSSIP